MGDPVSIVTARYWARITNYSVIILIPIAAYGPEEITSFLSQFFHLYKEKDIYFFIKLFQRSSGQLLTTCKAF